MSVVVCSYVCFLTCDESCGGGDGGCDLARYASSGVQISFRYLVVPTRGIEERMRGQEDK